MLTMDEIVRAALQPRLAKRNPLIVVESTPMGRDDWVRGLNAEWVAFDEAKGLDRTTITKIINRKRENPVAATPYKSADAKPRILPMTIEGAPNGGYLVKGGFYDYCTDKMDGLAYAGTLDDCLAYVKAQMEEMRAAREPKPEPVICDCGKGA